MLDNWLSVTICLDIMKIETVCSYSDFLKDSVRAYEAGIKNNLTNSWNINNCDCFSFGRLKQLQVENCWLGPGLKFGHLLSICPLHEN